MSPKRKIFVFALIALGALFIALPLFLVTWTWESPALTQAVLAALASDDVQVDAQRVRLKILGGIVMDDVQIKTRLEDGTLEASARELILTHQPLGLMSGKIAVKEFRLVEPAINIVWDAPKKKGLRPQSIGVSAVATAPAADTEAGAWVLAIDIGRIALEEGRLVMSEEGLPDEMVRFEGLSVELEDLRMAAGSDLIKSLEAHGTLKAEKMINPALVAEGVEGRLKIGGGHVVIEELQLPSSDLGVLVISPLDLDLGRDPYVFRLSGQGTPLKTATLFGGSSGFGDSELRFEIDGDGSPKGGPRGQGTVAVREGQLGALPLLSSLEILLANTGLIGRAYQPFTVPFTLDGDFVDLQPFTVVAGNLSLSAYGRVDLNGPLNLHIEVALPRADVAVKEIPFEVLEALTDVDGQVKLPILIRGTIEQPAPTFDTRAWGRILGRRAVDKGVSWLTKKLRD